MKTGREVILDELDPEALQSLSVMSRLEYIEEVHEYILDIQDPNEGIDAICSQITAGLVTNAGIASRRGSFEAAYGVRSPKGAFLDFAIDAAIGDVTKKLNSIDGLYHNTFSDHSQRHVELGDIPTPEDDTQFARGIAIYWPRLWTSNGETISYIS